LREFVDPGALSILGSIQKLLGLLERNQYLMRKKMMI